jgi:hypothetical protein
MAWSSVNIMKTTEIWIKKSSHALPAFDHAAVNLMEKYVYCISITAFGQCKILKYYLNRIVDQDMKYSR